MSVGARFIAGDWCNKKHEVHKSTTNKIEHIGKYPCSSICYMQAVNFHRTTCKKSNITRFNARTSHVIVIKDRYHELKHRLEKFENTSDLSGESYIV